MRHLLGFVLLIFVALLTACGGGGGGTGSSSLSYEGVTTQAAINDATTAADLSAAAYYGTSVDEMLPAASLQGGAQSSTVSVPVIQKLSRMVMELPESTESTSSVNTLAAISLPADTMDCFESGTYTISMSIDELTLSTSMALSFANCNDGDGIIINGSMSSVMDKAGSSETDLNHLTMEFIAEKEKITTDGTISYSFDDVGTLAMIMNLVMSEEFTGGMVKLENYTVELTTSDEMTVTGKVYSSDFGFVLVKTPVTIVLDPITGEPVSGVYRIDGESGTWAEVDFSITTGDQGTYGDDSGTLGTFFL